MNGLKHSMPWHIVIAVFIAVFIAASWSQYAIHDSYTADDETIVAMPLTCRVSPDPLNHRYGVGLVLGSADSRHVVTSNGHPGIGTMRIFRLQGDKLVEKFDAKRLTENKVICRDIGRELVTVAASPTRNDIFATSWSGEIFRVSLDDAQLTPLGHGRQVGNIAVSPDGLEFVVLGEDLRPKVCDVETGAARVILDPANNDGKGRSTGSTNFTFSTDGRYIVGYCRGNSIFVIWDAASGEKLTTVKDAHPGAMIVDAVSAGKSGKFITVAATDSGVNRGKLELGIWLFENGGLVRRIPHPDELNYSSQGIFVEEDGTFLCPYHDRIVNWDIVTGKIVRDIRLADVDHQTRPNLVTHDGKIVCGIAAGKRLVLWDATTGKMLTTPQAGHRTAIGHIASTAGGQEIVTTGYDGTICRWDVDGTEVMREAIDVDSLTTFTRSPSDRSFFVGYAGFQVRGETPPHPVLERRDEKGFFVLNRYEYPRAASVTKCAVSPDGQLVAACLSVIRRSGEVVVVWDKTSGRKLHEFSIEEDNWPSMAIGFGEDGAELQVISSEGQCLCFDMKVDGKRREFSVVAHVPDAEPKRPEDRISSATFGESRKTVVMGAGRWIGIYDTAKGKLKRRIELKEEYIASHVFGLSPNDEWLAVADTHKYEALTSDTVQLWNLATGQKVVTWKSPDERPTAIGFSHDGRSLLLGMDNGGIEIRRLPPVGQ